MQIDERPDAGRRPIFISPGGKTPSPPHLPLRDGQGGVRGRTLQAFPRRPCPRPLVNEVKLGLRADVASARGQHHHDLTAFETRLLLDLGQLGGVALDAVEQFVAEVLVRHFAAAEAQSDFDLVALFEKPLH